MIRASYCQHLQYVNRDFNGKIAENPYWGDKRSMTKTKDILARIDNGSDQLQDRYLLLNKNGELELIRSEDENFNTHLPRTLINDAYTFETLEEIYWQPHAKHLHAHLHPPESHEMAFYMIQRYILPVIRDLEIIQCGLEQALERVPKNKNRVQKAMRCLFERIFCDLQKAKEDIYKSVENDSYIKSVPTTCHALSA